VRTLLVWTAERVTENDLRAFAETEGGYWNDVVGGEAVIERGTGRVFLAVDANADDALVEDFEYATKQLGSKPVSVVYVKIGHGESEPLAEDVATRVVQRWRGFIDRNEVTQPS
jgi:hypothetical protein